MILIIPVLIIKEHIKNNKHEYYKTNYDTEKDIKRKIKYQTDKFLQKQLKKVRKVRNL